MLIIFSFRKVFRSSISDKEVKNFISRQEALFISLHGKQAFRPIIICYTGGASDAGGESQAHVLGIQNTLKTM